MSISVRACLLFYIQLYLISYVSGASFESSDVLKLTSKNFDEQVAAAKVTAIKFYAPWCGHCKKLAPTWKQLGAAYKDDENVDIAHIDCTKNATVCKKAQVGGYPKLVIYYNGKEQGVYRGPRDVESLQKYINGAVKDLTQETES